MSNSMSMRSAVIVGKETTFGTEAARTVAIPANSEGLSADEQYHISGAMRGDVADLQASPGQHQGGGSIEVELDGSQGGAVLRWLARRAVTPAAASYQHDAEPTVATSGVGTIPAGTYRYAVVPVFTRTGYEPRFGGSSGNQSTVAVNGSEGVLVQWLNPTPPSGWTLAGTMIFRTAAGGGAGTEKYLAWANGGGTTQYTDTGSATLETGTAVPKRLYEHSFDDGSNTADPPANSVEVLKDNGTSELWLGTHANSGTISVPAESTPVTLALDLIARQLVIESSPTTPAFADVAAFMGYRAIFSFGDDLEALSESELAASFEASISNNFERKFNLNGSRYARKHKAGKSTVEVTISADYENTTLLENYLENGTFAARVEIEGPSTGDVIEYDGSNDGAPWPYVLRLDFPRLKLMTHTAPSSGDGSIMQQLTLRALKDPAYGYSWRATLTNTQSSAY